LCLSCGQRGFRETADDVLENVERDIPKRRGALRLEETMKELRREMAIGWRVLRRRRR
jgi:hypothetical protein